LTGFHQAALQAGEKAFFGRTRLLFNKMSLLFRGVRLFDLDQRGGNGFFFFNDR